MTMLTFPNWESGDILQSKDGKSIVEFWSFQYEVEEYGLCFSGVEVSSYESSGSWLIDKFKKSIKKNKPNADKGFRVVSAVYRLMKRKRIKKDKAIQLINSRASISLKTATATVEIWLRYPLKDLYK